MQKYNIPVEAALEVIGGKWKVVILCHLILGTRRTGELKRLMPGITQKMLTQQLRELEEDGMITRFIYNQVPPKVEYSLTKYGQSLKDILDSLCTWGEKHIERKYENKFDVLKESILNEHIQVSPRIINMDESTEIKKYNIPVEAALEVIGGKWKVVILCHLILGTRRTGELKRLMPGITQKMLTQQLRELEEDGMITRFIYNQVPPKVEYSLTKYGQSLKDILDWLCAWGGRHIERNYENKFDMVKESILNEHMKKIQNEAEDLYIE
ncbi:hypothetical protein ShirakiTB12_17900 [Priestia megaterium]|uniref:HTH hxlR-type domain-containing protein n=2 Tax=Bacillaceae TaxID=186817 RepID=A0AAX6BHT5_PRIMG|nr:hypothetical protein ShirakiTB12_17900 [Priestia megaterium]